MFRYEINDFLRHRMAKPLVYFVLFICFCLYLKAHRVVMDLEQLSIFCVF